MKLRNTDDLELKNEKIKTIFLHSNSFHFFACLNTTKIHDQIIKL